MDQRSDSLCASLTFITGFLVLSILCPWAFAESFVLSSTPFKSGTPGVWSTTSLAPAVGATQVIMTVRAVADLGCSQWDQSHAFHSCNSGTGCDTVPTDKQLRIRINAGLGSTPVGGILIDSANTNQASGHGPVPTGGTFFQQWANDDPLMLEYGRSPCAGDVQGAPNTHVFTVDAETWNGWLSPSGYIEIRVDATNVASLESYCASIHPTPCNCSPCAPTTSVEIEISYTGVPLGSCCVPATAACNVTWEAACGLVCGVWTEDETCSPNPCSVEPMGACCFGSGICAIDSEVHCGCVGGTYGGDDVACEPNPCTQPPILYVDINASGSPSGADWTNAFTSLESALTAAVANSGGEQIWVAGGTYKPSVPTGSDATFQLLNDVAIYGGFAGDETTLEERNIAANPTILSGDIGTPNVTSDNAYHVVTGSLLAAQVGRSALLDGFVIYAGNADGADLTAVGGGLLIVQGGPTIRDCAFVGNRAKDAGGGVYCSSSTSTFVNCTFSGNDAYGTVAEAGGLRSSGSNLTLTNCSFTANHATQTGGGVHHNIGTLAVFNCIFWNNTRGSSTPMTDSAAQIQIGLGTAIVQYTDVQGSFTGTGNINSDPLFVDANGDDNTVGTLDDNLRLMTTSPCIDAANNLADIDAGTPGIQPLLNHDADLHARRMDDPDKMDTGVVSCPIVDMGAYEFRRICEATSDCVTRGDSDTDTDGVVDGLDIQPFAECLTQADPECTGECQCFDMDLDGFVTMESDLPCFIAVLLDQPECVVECSAPTFRSGIDCNENGLPDSYDLIVALTSEDCNANGIPDECEIDENSPAEGGPWYCESDCATDINDNGIPDECEDDCNTNGIPDAWDISEETSDDVNTNGIPDECEKDCNTNGIPDAWDISETTSADCNADGTPDECEDDCNTNGVPDDCDVDPTDPDGDEWVSPDCNENGYPDECDMSLPPPFGSGDCNTNGIPDECDIADCESDPSCDDCNENGIPDGCDIDAEISEDTDTNGIPDECEGESLMGGGGEESMMSSGEGGDSEWSEEAAWESFYEWSITQCWGLECEAGMDEQFEAMIDKLRELGLPEERP